MKQEAEIAAQLVQVGHWEKLLPSKSGAALGHVPREEGSPCFEVFQP